MYQVQPMQIKDAREIQTWQYPPPYNFYNTDPGEETLLELLKGEFFTVHEGEDGCIGFYCFGYSARIPLASPQPYEAPALDIGLGLSPGQCGQGRGLSFVERGIEYAYATFSPPRLRLAVACFNKRAITVYMRAGFKKQETVLHKQTGFPFQIMTRERA